MKLDTQVLVAGGGPVGLYLALALLAEGVDVRVVERDASPRAGSRSIGIHPPSLELMGELGLADVLIGRGVRVRRGRAVGARGELGVVDFSTCPAPYRYVLAVPQAETERTLREAVEARAPGAIEHGSVMDVFPGSRDVAVHVARGDREALCRAEVVVACDGRHSRSRERLGIPFDGVTYPGRYVMADFPDETTLGADAAIYIDDRGLVESFPLPHGIRRWVVRLGEGEIARAPSEPDIARAIVERVASRCGLRLDGARAVRPSAFRAERRVARTLAMGRVALAGDAAHVVSPIGGQGMNLGWLGARALAADLAAAFRRGGSIDAALAVDARRRERLARAAARRAELNMWLGRPLPRPWTRDVLLRSVLRSPVSGLLGRLFTMRGLAFGV